MSEASRSESAASAPEDLTQNVQKGLRNGNPHGSARKRTSTKRGMFTSSPDMRCPDCEYAGRLANDGLPFMRGGALRPQHVWALFRSSEGCDTCGGTGRVPISTEIKAGRTSNDPMEIAQKG